VTAVEMIEEERARDIFMRLAEEMAGERVWMRLQRRISGRQS
jgi:hypothetical protein